VEYTREAEWEMRDTSPPGVPWHFKPCCGAKGKGGAQGNVALDPFFSAESRPSLSIPFSSSPSARLASRSAFLGSLCLEYETRGRFSRPPRHPSTRVPILRVAPSIPKFSLARVTFPRGSISANQDTLDLTYFGALRDTCSHTREFLPSASGGIGHVMK